MILLHVKILLTTFERCRNSFIHDYKKVEKYTFDYESLKSEEFQFVTEIKFVPDLESRTEGVL